MITTTCIGFGKALGRISKPMLKSLRPYKSKQHKQWLDEECLRFLDQRKHVKMQCCRVCH